MEQRVATDVRSAHGHRNHRQERVRRPPLANIRIWNYEILDTKNTTPWHGKRNTPEQRDPPNASKVKD